MRVSSFAHLAILALAAAWLFSACSVKHITYLQDMEPGETVKVIEREDLHLKVGDRISIVVTSKNPALAAPFAMVSSSPVVDPKTGEISNVINNEDARGYLIDKQGYIDFPVLGKLYLQGLTLDEVRELVTKKIIELDYIKDPIVLVDFKNFQIMMLGESGKGVFTIQGESIDIFHFLAKCGDLSYMARRKDLWVIRDVNGDKKLYTIDLTKKDCFQSPVYYLQQDDFIYARPRSVRVDPGVTTALSWVGIGTSIVSMVTTIIILAAKL